MLAPIIHATARIPRRENLEVGVIHVTGDYTKGTDTKSNGPDRVNRIPVKNANCPSSVRPLPGAPVSASLTWRNAAHKNPDCPVLSGLNPGLVGGYMAERLTHGVNSSFTSSCLLPLSTMTGYYMAGVVSRFDVMEAGALEMITMPIYLIRAVDTAES